MQRGRSSRSSTTMHERSPAGLLRCWRRIDGQRSSVPEVKSSRDGKRGRRGGSHVNFTGSSAAATSDCRTSHARSATRLARTCPFAATRSSVSRGSRLGSGGSTRSRWVVKKPSWRSASGARREESLCISRARGSSTSFPRRGRRGDTSQRAAGPRDARRQASPNLSGEMTHSPPSAAMSPAHCPAALLARAWRSLAEIRTDFRVPWPSWGDSESPQLVMRSAASAASGLLYAEDAAPLRRRRNA